jgi:hypothetical protein
VPLLETKYLPIVSMNALVRAVNQMFLDDLLSRMQFSLAFCMFLAASKHIDRQSKTVQDASTQTIGAQENR